MSLVQIILEGRKEDFAKKFSNKFTEEQLRAIIDKSDVLPGQHKYLNFLGKVVNPKNFNTDLNIVVKLLEKFSTVSQNLSLKDINQYDRLLKTKWKYHKVRRRTSGVATFPYGGLPKPCNEVVLKYGNGDISESS